VQLHGRRADRGAVLSCQPAVKQPVKTTVKPAVKLAVKQAVKQAVKPDAKQAAKQAVNQAAKQVMKQAVKQAAKQAVKQAVKPAAKPAAKRPWPEAHMHTHTCTCTCTRTCVLSAQRSSGVCLSSWPACQWCRCAGARSARRAAQLWRLLAFLAGMPMVPLRQRHRPCASKGTYPFRLGNRELRSGARRMTLPLSLGIEGGGPPLRCSAARTAVRRGAASGLQCRS